MTLSQEDVVARPDAVIVRILLGRMAMMVMRVAVIVQTVVVCHGASLARPPRQRKLQSRRNPRHIGWAGNLPSGMRQAKFAASLMEPLPR